MDKINDLKPTTPSAWPPRPAEWPVILTDIEVALYLRLDDAGHDPASAKRVLRFIRRTQGLPDVGRIAGKVLFRKQALDEWLARREGRHAARANDEESESTKPSQDGQRIVRS